MGSLSHRPPIRVHSEAQGFLSAYRHVPVIFQVFLPLRSVQTRRESRPISRGVCQSKLTLEVSINHGSTSPNLKC